jgi:hypothetical protein
VEELQKLIETKQNAHNHSVPGSDRYLLSDRDLKKNQFLISKKQYEINRLYDQQNRVKLRLKDIREELEHSNDRRKYLEQQDRARAYWRVRERMRASQIGEADTKMKHEEAERLCLTEEELLDWNFEDAEEVQPAKYTQREIDFYERLK